MVLDCVTVTQWEGKIMRIRVEFDSATTAEVRALSVALLKAELPSGNELTLGVEGPECWHGATPNLRPDQFVLVFAELMTPWYVSATEAVRS